MINKEVAIWRVYSPVEYWSVQCNQATTFTSLMKLEVSQITAVLWGVIHHYFENKIIVLNVN